MCSTISRALAQTRTPSDLYYNAYMASDKTRDKVLTFRPDPDTFDAMKSLRERDGVPFSEQIRRALRAWLEAKKVMKQSTALTSRKRARVS